MKTDLINKLKHTAHIWVPVLVMVLYKLVFTGIALAHDCSTEADCLQTAGYNTVLGVGGGLIAILAALFGAHLGGAAGVLTPMGEEPPDTGTKGATVETPPEGPVIIDADGERLPNWSPEYAAGENGYEGKPGDVWYDGNWVDPDYAREQVAEDIHYDNLRDIEREAFWSDVQDASQQWLSDRHQQLEQEAALERQENQSRQDALDLLDRIEDSAIRHGASDILQRAEENAWNPDGSINPDYVNRLRDAMRNRIGLDIAAPDEQLQQGWVSEALQNTWDDARHNPLIRIGAGVLSGGSSEIYFQSQAAWEAMQRSYDEAVKQGKGDDWGYGDALFAGGQQLVEENLPVNIIKTVMDPNATSTDILLATAMDMFTAMDTAETIQNLRGSFSVVRGGGSAWDALTHRADPIRFFPGEEAEVPTGPTGPHDIDAGGGRVDVEGPRGVEGPGRADIETPVRADVEGGGRGFDEGMGGRLDEGGARIDEGGTRIDEGGTRIDEGGTRVDEGGARIEEEGFRADEGGIKADEGGARVEDEGFRADEGGIKADEGARIDEAGSRRIDEAGTSKVDEDDFMWEGDRGMEGQRGQEGDWGAEGSHGAERNVDTLDPGTQVEPAEFGIPDANAREIQRIANEYDVDIEMRQTNPHSTPKLEQGYPPKPCDIKTKTISELDLELGAKPNQLGEAGYFEPKLPEGVKYDDLSPELQARYNQRFEEFSVQGPVIQRLEADGAIKVEDGVIINNGLVDEGVGKPFVGDHDIFKITGPDGNPVPSNIEQDIVNRLNGEFGGGGHGQHMSPDWNPQQALSQEARYGIANNHLPVADGGGGEALIKFSRNQPPVTSFARAPDVGSIPQPPELRSLEFFDEASGSWKQ